MLICCFDAREVRWSKRSWMTWTLWWGSTYFSHSMSNYSLKLTWAKKMEVLIPNLILHHSKRIFWISSTSLLLLLLVSQRQRFMTNSVMNSISRTIIFSAVDYMDSSMYHLDLHSNALYRNQHLWKWELSVGSLSKKVLDMNISIRLRLTQVALERLTQLI